MDASTHQWPFYPGTGAAGEAGDGDGYGFTVNHPLDYGSGDDEFLAAIDDALARAADFQPELVFISAGFDAHRDDPLAGLNWTEADFAWITHAICDLAEETCAGRVVSSLEGGYDLDALGASVAQHVKVLMERGA